ncbi:MAG: hypothetical protein ACYCTD_05300, partial [bacterium]
MERKSVARQNLTVVLISFLIDISIFVFAGYRTAVVMGAILALLDGLITLGIYLKAVTGDISYYKDKKLVYLGPRNRFIDRINSASSSGIKYRLRPFKILCQSSIIKLTLIKGDETQWNKWNRKFQIQPRSLISTA